MNIIFFGTSEFAIPALRAISDSHHKILALVTQPDRKRGTCLAPRRLPAAKPTHGEANRAALQDVLGYPVQAKLKLGTPDDAHEREADTMADRVMAMPEGKVQRKCGACAQEDDKKMEADKAEPAPKKEEEAVQRKENGTSPTVGDAGSASLGAHQGGGLALPPGEQSKELF